MSVYGSEEGRSSQVRGFIFNVKVSSSVFIYALVLVIPSDDCVGKGLGECVLISF